MGLCGNAQVWWPLAAVPEPAGSWQQTWQGRSILSQCSASAHVYMQPDRPWQSRQGGDISPPLNLWRIQVAEVDAAPVPLLRKFSAGVCILLQVRTVSKSHKSTEKPGCTKSRIFILCPCLGHLTGCGLFWWTGKDAGHDHTHSCSNGRCKKYQKNSTIENSLQQLEAADWR